MSKYKWLASDEDGTITMFECRPVFMFGDWEHACLHSDYNCIECVEKCPEWIKPGQLYQRVCADDRKSVYRFEGSFWTLVEEHSISGTVADCKKQELPEHVQDDTVNHPSHYKSHPSGLECIQVTEHMGFLDGNAIKYIWRHKDKGKPLEDLKKARWYIDRLISKHENS